MDGYSELLLGGFMVKEVFKLHRQLRHLVQKVCLLLDFIERTRTSDEMA